MTDTHEAVEAVLDAFDAGDPEAISASFAADGSILDGMAWACAKGQRAS